MSVLAANSHVLSREVQYLKDQQPQAHYLLNWGSSVLLPKATSGFYWVDYQRNRDCKKVSRGRDLQFRAKVSWFDSSRPTMVEMEPIKDCDHLDQILQNAQELSQPILIDWMASWCRKCIYLKPKLEKLAAEFDTKMKFYYVDVNKVPQALVKRANIVKMPTIQLWKDGEMKAEVIGGHKAWLVIDEVREMIQKFV